MVLARARGATVRGSWQCEHRGAEAGGSLYFEKPEHTEINQSVTCGSASDRGAESGGSLYFEKPEHTEINQSVTCGSASDS